MEELSCSLALRLTNTFCISVVILPAKKIYQYFPMNLSVKFLPLELLVRLTKSSV